MDFDESDESVEEEDVNSVFSIYNCLQVEKRASSWWGQGSLGLLEAMKATISNIFEAGEEIHPRSSHQHSGGEAVQLDGLPAQRKKAPLVRGEHVHCPCSFSSRTISSSNPLLEQLYLQINVDYEKLWLFHQICVCVYSAWLTYNKMIAINSSTLSK